MFERISRGYHLARSSWGVLLQDKHLLWFPFVSGLLMLLVIASFAIPIATLVDPQQFQQQTENNDGKPPVWVYPVAFAFYFCSYFVIIFCNSALVGCALIRFNGGEPSVRDGFRIAFARLPQIFTWALVSATVGMALKALEGANEKVGIWVSRILGAAWSIMTYFVVPVLVVEKVGPIEAVSRSVAILRKSWGEAAVGNLGLGLFMFLLFIPVILLFVGAGLAFNAGIAPVGIALVVAGVVAFLLHAAVSTALNTILLAALYKYAADQQVAPGFDRQAFEGAFSRSPA